jgi:hypothetical protein
MGAPDPLLRKADLIMEEPKASLYLILSNHGMVDLEAMVKLIKLEKKTGSLTINFSQGGIGRFEWRQRVPSPAGELTHLHQTNGII